MKVTVRPSVVLAFNSTRGRAVAFFVLAVLRAALISGFIYFAFGLFIPWRWPLLAKAIHLLAQALQIPIFLFSHSIGLLIPYLASPFDFDWPSTHCMAVLDPSPWLSHHLRAGIITYTALFHVPAAVRWFRSRSGASDGQVAT